MSETSDFIRYGKRVYTDPARDVYTLPDDEIMLVDLFFPDGILLTDAPAETLHDFLLEIIRALDREDVRLVDLSYGRESAP